MRSLRTMKPRTILTALATLVVVAALGVSAVAVGDGTSGTTVTRARLERSLPEVFANLYANQAQILGRPGITPASLQAKAACDKGGATSADVGAGATWVCLMSWSDPNVPMPSEGYGKFELNVHSNNCYTALGQTKLTGFLTINDVKGNEVNNPVFEFDGCFDPNADNTPTGHSFPSLTQIVSTALALDANGMVGVRVSCGTGAAGCSGTATMTAGTTTLGVVPYQMVEESTVILQVPSAISTGTTHVEVTLAAKTGYASTSATTLPVQ